MLLFPVSGRGPGLERLTFNSQALKQDCCELAGGVKRVLQARRPVGRSGGYESKLVRPVGMRFQEFAMQRSTHKLLSSMRDSNTVVFALCSLLSEVSGEGRFPHTDVFSSIEKRISQIARTSLLHVSVSACCLEFAGFVSRRREAGIGQESVRRVEAGEYFR